MAPKREDQGGASIAAHQQQDAALEAAGDLTNAPCDLPAGAGGTATTGKPPLSGTAATLARAAAPRTGTSTSSDPESPADVAVLAAAAAADSLQTATSSSCPATPPADTATSSSGQGAGSCGRGAASPSPPSPAPSSLSQADAVDLALALSAAEAAAAAEHVTSLRRRSSIEVPAIIERLKQRPLTGQVVAWGWDAAAVLSGVRRTMPAQLFSTLWPATEACVYGRMTPQDVLEMLESWLTLMQLCPRHFRLAKGVAEPLATYALPPAVKRMGEKQLAQLAQLAHDIALHRSDAGMQTMSTAVQQGSSPRDLMQPVFALVAAEVAWRCCNTARYVSAQTISAVLLAAPAWSWRVVRHRDSQALAALKLATAAALEELLPHSPQDLRLSPAYGKLKTASSGTLGSRDSSFSLGAGLTLTAAAVP